MKITTKEKKVEFGDLKYGDIFLNKIESAYYMKLSNVGYIDNRAVNLASGWVSEFTPNGIVYQVECELTIL